MAFFYTESVEMGNGSGLSGKRVMKFYRPQAYEWPTVESLDGSQEVPEAFPIPIIDPRKECDLPRLLRHEAQERGHGLL